MTHFRRAAAFALALTGTLALAAPAAAAPSSPAVPINPSQAPGAAAPAKPANCGDLLLCLYTDANFYGRRQDAYARANGTCDGVLYNDQISSIWNGSGKSVRFYNNAGCSGTAFSLANGGSSALMTITHPTSVDEITSYKWGA